MSKYRWIRILPIYEGLFEYLLLFCSGVKTVGVGKPPLGGYSFVVRKTLNISRAIENIHTKIKASNDKHHSDTKFTNDHISDMNNHICDMLVKITDTSSNTGKK